MGNSQSNKHIDVNAITNLIVELNKNDDLESIQQKMSEFTVSDSSIIPDWFSDILGLSTFVMAFGTLVFFYNQIKNTKQQLQQLRRNDERNQDKVDRVRMTVRNLVLAALISIIK